MTSRADWHLAIAVLTGDSAYLRAVQCYSLQTDWTGHQEMARTLRRQFWSAGFWMLTLVLAGVLLGGAIGGAGLKPFASSTLWSAASVLFGGWGTWLALADASPSIDGVRADERARRVLFRILFGAGVLLGAVAVRLGQ